MKNLNAILLSGMVGLLLGLAISYYFICNQCYVKILPFTGKIDPILDSDARKYFKNYIPTLPPSGQVQINDTLGFSLPAAVIREANSMINQQNLNPADGVRFYPGMNEGNRVIVFIGLKKSVSDTIREMTSTARIYQSSGSNVTDAGPCPTWCDNNNIRIIIKDSAQNSETKIDSIK